LYLSPSPGPCRAQDAGWYGGVGIQPLLCNWVATPDAKSVFTFLNALDRRFTAKDIHLAPTLGCKGHLLHLQ
jgi:hypothetical protein